MEAAFWIIVAAFAQVALTLGLAIQLGFARVPLIARGEVRPRDVALSRDAWPEPARRVAIAFDNQFQLPVLFYFVVLVCAMAGIGAQPVVWLAWAFVATRFVHAAIVVTSNNVVHRFWPYIAGALLLIAMVVTVALLLPPAISSGGV